ncbi:MAG TPA: peptidylprolyl isomerase [Hyphomicrobiaceae bacterium]|nr:peptidylprolyl isomerase [Hyphomicrobiaceae bacterium]
MTYASFCRTPFGRVGVLAGVFALMMAPALAQDAKPVATINGKVLTEADVKLADQEIGPELAQLPEATKRRVLVEYLIENEVFASAAADAKLASGPVFEQRMAYWKRRALRDLYFETSVREAVKESDAKAFYDEQVKAMKPQEEVKAAHILVEDEAKAKELAEKIAKGGDFAALAKEHSKDPGSKDQGGDLGFFGRGQMVPEFEKAAFETEKGKVSAPVKSAFGWHIVKVEDKRTKEPPSFDSVKDRILGSLLQQKAQSIGTELRNKAKIEYVAEDLKKAMAEDEAKAKAAQEAQKAAAEGKKDAPAKK